MSAPTRLRKVIVAVSITWAAVKTSAGDAPATPPMPSELEESIEVRLVTVDVVALEADDTTVPNMTKRDFKLYVDGIPTAIDTLDTSCASGAEPDSKSIRLGQWPTSRDRPIGTRRIVLAFDYLHLSTAACPGTGVSASTGSAPLPCLFDTKVLQEFRNVLEAKTEIADEEMMVVALNGGIRIEQPFTKDRQAVIAALLRMENDLSLVLNSRIRATEYPFFDSLRALITVLRATPGPKAVVVVTTGSGPGDDYDLSYEKLAAAANDAKVALYPVDGRGIFVDTHERFINGTHSGAPGPPPGLFRLASMTGGRLTSNTNDSTIGYARARHDLGCRYTIGFYDHRPEADKRHQIRIKSRRSGVHLIYANRFSFTSEKERWTQTLEAAFLAPQRYELGGLRASIIPQGGDGKSWKAAVQLRLPPSGVADTSAELGASVVYDAKVKDQFSAALATKSGERAIVLEKSLDLAPGAFSVVAVAGDVRRGQVVSARIDVVWPDPAKSAAAIAPIAVLQKGLAAMSKDGTLDASGSLARDVDEPLDPAANITLETVVCRGANTTASIVVERIVEGVSASEFAPMTIEPTGDPCIQIVDVVRAGRLQPGGVDYRVTARIGDDVVAQERRALRVGGVGDSR